MYKSTLSPTVLGQGWRTHDTRAQNDSRKDFLGTRHPLLSQLFYIICPTRVFILRGTCIYIYIYTHTFLTAYTLCIITVAAK
jgi:hypothetical protein